MFSSPAQSSHQHEIHIRIDRTEYHTTQHHLTGAQLRALPTPPIGADRDLYLVRPGGDDELITTEQQVQLRDGLRLYTTPSHINPGQH